MHVLVSLIQASARDMAVCLDTELPELYGI